MKNEILWSLRLGFSTEQSKSIEKLGIEDFLKQSFKASYNTTVPDLLKDSPKTFEDFKAIRKTKKDDPEKSKELLKQENQTLQELKAWWIEQIASNEFPLREKMTLFWHNHFVTSSQKVKINYWLFQNNQLYREEAFGNFKTLTKKTLQTNAMVRYLDNTDNRKGKSNENLSRELLELFTLGIGNYSESDIKNGAKGLAGLGIGKDGAVYHPFFEDNDSIEYLGKKGTLKMNEMVNAIFDHPKIPYLLTKKILQWFIYDQPKDELIQYYGKYFKKVNFEIEPLLLKIFTEEFAKKETSGAKIKNPLEYSLQLIDELHIENPNMNALVYFLKQQGMDLFNQPNVKGWDGGNSWLTSQIYLQRNNIADMLCNGRNFNRQKSAMENNVANKQSITPTIDWNPSENNKGIIKGLTDRMLFTVDKSSQEDFEKILKYDFDPKSPGADNAVLRLFNAIVKSPEFQII
ncbi:DUF1800 domain-containing protein [Flavobacterium gilvum]|uniref:Uncharacterized protein n=1 Tax=Flavobacterium gilvum TaxID=1492737 RepID=A0AAC9N4M0_9FLAO|nr:DUF1800 domain-containing protein [Flavobacterium gilvum]AOW08082.1 hypothetical protein EM308_00365 [Flavobacterium gilvum]KFC58846.1 hypothetical protein FEM08_23340 [Flavobacterium gilvum]